MALIVLINSQSGFAHAIETTLRHAGYEVLSARNAQEAIDSLNGQAPKLIILGDTAQSMFHQTTILKANLLMRDVPIMLQSSNYSIFNVAYQQRLGAQVALANSFSSSHLIQIVQEWVNISHVV